MFRRSEESNTAGNSHMNRFRELTFDFHKERLCTENHKFNSNAHSVIIYSLSCHHKSFNLLSSVKHNRRRLAECSGCSSQSKLAA